MTTIPAGSALDRAGQRMLADDRDAGSAATHQLAEPAPTGFADRIDQVWLPPPGDDDYYCLAY
ncbi:hypothetical protein ACIBCN_21880 [Nocardia sp. NPDC051052]|uniref:hypothetical protein n=1 Tax=Nocardia sp. NPDC051052 TaxID=3364322 RepID=UPI00378B0A34